MIPIPLLMLVWLTVLVPLAGCTRAPFREEIAFHETADVKGVETVCVETKNGAIDVRCAKDADQADIQGAKFASGITPEDARRRAEEVQIEVQRDGARPTILRIVAKFPVVDSGNRGASFRITLPQAVATELLTSNGEVSVAGAARDVHVETSNGRISITDVQGGAYARTSNGRVDAKIKEGAVKDFHSSRHSVTATLNDGAGTVDIQSSNGSVTLRTDSPER
jgi:DUF4097 and DUF4098 domain-containing protein YvlB